MRIDLALITAAGTLLLAACGGADGGIASTGKAPFGESVRQTFAAQVVNPAPDYAGTDLHTSGSRAALAVERYQTDKVKKPDHTATSNLSTGGGK